MRTRTPSTIPIIIPVLVLSASCSSISGGNVVGVDGVLQGCVVHGLLELVSGVFGVGWLVVTFSPCQGPSKNLQPGGREKSSRAKSPLRPAPASASTTSSQGSVVAPTCTFPALQTFPWSPVASNCCPVWDESSYLAYILIAPTSNPLRWKKNRGVQD